jgi:hypothetical protein
VFTNSRSDFLSVVLSSKVCAIVWASSGPGLSDSTIARLRWLKFSLAAGVAPGGIGSPNRISATRHWCLPRIRFWTLFSTPSAGSVIAGVTELHQRGLTY